MKISPASGPSAPLFQGSKPSGTPSSADVAKAKLTASMNNQAPTPVAQADVVSPDVATRSPSLPPETEGQDHTIESPSSEAPKAAEEPISSQYAALARREKALRAQSEQFKQRELALKAREDALTAVSTPKAKEFDESKYVSRDKLKSSTFEVLAEEGLTYEDLVERAMNAPKPEELARKQYEKSIDEKLAKLEAAQEDAKKQSSEQQKQAYDQALNQMRNQTKSLVASDPAFEAIKETNSVEDVIDLIKQTFEQDGELLSVEEAATQVEAYLIEEAMKLTRIKKIQQRHLEASTKASAPTTSNPQLKTLTNSTSASRTLSSRERAMLAFKGETKN